MFRVCGSFFFVSLAMMCVECVKSVEGVRCSVWWIVRGYVGAGMLLE